MLASKWRKYENRTSSKLFTHPAILMHNNHCKSWLQDDKNIWPKHPDKFSFAILSLSLPITADFHSKVRKIFEYNDHKPSLRHLTRIHTTNFKCWLQSEESIWIEPTTLEVFTYYFNFVHMGNFKRLTWK
jgi:hypothetical protein